MNLKNVQRVFGILGSVTAIVTFVLPLLELYKLKWAAAPAAAPAQDPPQDPPAQAQPQAQLQAPPAQLSMEVALNTLIMRGLLWSLYGAIIEDGYLMVNFFGMFLGIVYLNLLHLIIKVSGSKCKVFFIIREAVYALGLGSLLFKFHPTKASGYICGAGSIILLILKKFYGARTTPVEEFAAFFVDGVMWAVYGFVSSSMVIGIPNLFAAVAELVIFVIQSRRNTPEAQVNLD